MFATTSCWCSRERRERSPSANVCTSRSGAAPGGACLPDGGDTSISWREALIELTHEELQHQGRDKTAHALRAKYWWPGLAADVERVLADCEPCAKAKAQRTLAHGKYRAVPAGAPRKRWGMDFYGVESGYILSLIDLDSGVYEPVFLKNRAAEGVAQALLDNVICRYGVPLEVRSDDAQEFVGKCLNRLSQAIGFRISSTHGYHPEGNAKVERIHAYLGQCLRRMSDEQYRNIADQLPLIRWGWLSAINATTGLSPFEIDHGCPPRLISDVTAVGAAPATIAVRELRERAKHFERVARERNDEARAKTAERLNVKRRSGHKNDFAIGDSVLVFVPPSQGEVKRRGRKKKHMVSWRGPCIIIAKLSGTTYSCRELRSERVFTRSISNMRACKEEYLISDRGADERLLREPLQGDIIAVPDGRGKFCLATITEVEDSRLRVDYMGTRGKNLKNATFWQVWIDPHDSRPMFSNKKRGAQRWHGIEGIDEVLCTGLQLTSTGKLTRASFELLKKTAGRLRHSRM